jgi:tetratricopeptide (TPR) repeat protein
MSTFDQLKRYPFFYTIMNWFRPFDLWQADVLGIVGIPNETSNPLASTVLQSNFMCDSDKYSFCYAIREIPQMQRDAMMAQLEEQNKAIKEHADMPDLKRLSKQTAQGVMRQYVQNLYRFFVLFPNVQEFDNPFSHLISRPKFNNPLYDSIVQPTHLFKLIGLNIKQKHYPRAIEYFSLLEENHPECMEATQLQQLGLCYQKMKRYDAAIEAYTKADLLKPDSYWTVHHLAQCHRERGNYKKAFQYYEIAESMKPDNLSLTYHAAEALFEMGHYEAAIPRLHKLDYHHPESLKVVRILADSYILTGKGQQAVRYYERIAQEHADELTSGDLRNMACCYWLMGDRKRCFEHLLLAEKLYSEDQAREPFANAVAAEMEFIERFVSNKEDVTFLYDAYCRYKKKL